MGENILIVHGGGPTSVINTVRCSKGSKKV